MKPALEFIYSSICSIVDCRFGDKTSGCMETLCPYYVNPEWCCETCHNHLFPTTVATTNIGRFNVIGNTQTIDINVFGHTYTVYAQKMRSFLPF